MNKSISRLCIVLYESLKHMVECKESQFVRVYCCERDIETGGCISFFKIFHAE